MPKSRAAAPSAAGVPRGPNAAERAASLIPRQIPRPPASARGRPGTAWAGVPGIGLSAVIVAASVQGPRLLTVRGGHDDDVAVEALPPGPLEAEHRTLEIGLRSWVERQTSQRLGYV